MHEMLPNYCLPFYLTVYFLVIVLEVMYHGIQRVKVLVLFIIFLNLINKP